MDRAKIRFNGPYAEQYKDGAQADAGERCPYSIGEMGARCAWLAGVYDYQGREAWERARLCRGCGRTFSEVIEWNRLSDKHKTIINERIQSQNNIKNTVQTVAVEPIL